MDGTVTVSSIVFIYVHCRGRQLGDPCGEAALAPPLGELLSVARLRGCATKYGCTEKYARHPLSQPVRAASSPRGRAEGASRRVMPSNQVLPKIRGCGRMLSAPTVSVCETVFERYVPPRVTKNIVFILLS